MNRSNMLLCITLPLLFMAVFIFEIQGGNSPTFKAGDCVSVDLSNEFERIEYKKIILEVGKTHYRVYSYGRNEVIFEPYGWKDVERIRFFNSVAVKIECPKNINAIVGPK